MNETIVKLVNDAEILFKLIDGEIEKRRGFDISPLQEISWVHYKLLLQQYETYKFQIRNHFIFPSLDTVRIISEKYILLKATKEVKYFPFRYVLHSMNKTLDYFRDRKKKFKSGQLAITLTGEVENVTRMLEVEQARKNQLIKDCKERLNIDLTALPTTAALFEELNESHLYTYAFRFSSQFIHNNARVITTLLAGDFQTDQLNQKDLFKQAHLSILILCELMIKTLTQISIQFNLDTDLEELERASYHFIQKNGPNKDFTASMVVEK